MKKPYRIQCPVRVSLQRSCFCCAKKRWVFSYWKNLQMPWPQLAHARYRYGSQEIESMILGRPPILWHNSIQIEKIHYERFFLEAGVAWLRTILWRSDSITKHTHPRNADVFYLPIIPSNLAESLHQTKPGNMWTFSMTSHSSFGGKDLRSGARFDVVCTMGTHVSFIFRGYKPYFGGVKPPCFMVFGSNGRL